MVIAISCILIILAIIFKDKRAGKYFIFALVGVSFLVSLYCRHTGTHNYDWIIFFNLGLAAGWETRSNRPEESEIEEEEEEEEET